ALAHQLALELQLGQARPDDEDADRHLPGVVDPFRQHSTVYATDEQRLTLVLAEPREDRLDRRAGDLEQHAVLARRELGDHLVAEREAREEREPVAAPGGERARDRPRDALRVLAAQPEAPVDGR